MGYKVVVKGFAKHQLRKALNHLPGPLRERYIRERHLQIVAANMQEFIEPAFLGKAVAEHIQWIKPDGRPPLPVTGFDPYSFSQTDAADARSWLAENPSDSDRELDQRTDNYYDEVGRVKSALRSRIWLAELDGVGSGTRGGRILIDARSIQSSVHGHRGIGRFAEAAVQAIVSSVDNSRVDLLVDPGLGRLPVHLLGGCSLVSRVSGESKGNYSGLIQPSPMTASPDPIVPLLELNITKTALVFDFIPLDYPSVYLKNPAERLEYAANLDALAHYNEFVCISQVAKDELVEFLVDSGATESVIQAGHRAQVAWPKNVLDTSIDVNFDSNRKSGPIVVITGDEPRKNTLGALSAIGAATVSEDPRNVVVLGMSQHGSLVHHLSMYAAMRPGEVLTSPRLSDSEMAALFSGASLAVIASFDEGLSLPVIEALRSGTPVVASDIAAHRELIGGGSYLANPSDPSDLCRAIRQHRGNLGTTKAQWSRLAKHNHQILESVITSVAERMLTGSVPISTDNKAELRSIPRRLSIGVATPWEPQPTGVADFSAATIRALSTLADVTVYTTSGAPETRDNALDSGITFKSVEALFDNHGVHEHDALLVVLGNSHFHVPFLELLSITNCIAIAHDTRMVELYMAIRGKGGAEDIMLRSLDASSPAEITPSLDDQIDDMRLLQNAGMWEVANRSRVLILHSASAANRIERETGARPIVLPFANQRVPNTEQITTSDRFAAAQRLGFDSSKINLATFGYVDFRTKMTDVVLEAAGWLVQWGHPVALHVVGAASDSQLRELYDRAQNLGVEFQVTGFVSDSVFRDYLLATDIGIQLRVSPLLGVSGPLSDLAAFGTTCVASSGLAIDVEAPDYVFRLPDWVSPLGVAESIEFRINNPLTAESKEAARVEYLRGKDPLRYAQLLLTVVKDVSFPTRP